MDAARATFTDTLAGGEDIGHLVLPFDPRAVWGRARPPVVVDVNGHRFRSTVAIMGGEAFVPFRLSHREAAGVGAGGTVEVTLTLDTAPRDVEPPADLAAALAGAGLADAWARLSVSHRREWAEAIEGAKRPETRAKRIGSCLAKLGC